MIAIATAVAAKTLIPLMIVSAALLLITVIFERDWARSLRLYALLAILVLATRVAFRIIFSFSNSSDQILLALPQLELNLGFGNSISLLGPVSQPALLAAVVDGLRLATIVLSIGMASTLANPKKLLKSTPGALYEVSAAVSMALNLAPQLVQSVKRVRQSSALRGRSAGTSALTSILIPVLEDTIEKSMGLAASMSSRGFGRAGALTAMEQKLVRAFSLASICLILIGTYLLLTEGLAQPFSAAALLFGLLFAGTSLRLAAARKIRTSFNPRKLKAIDLLAITISLAAFAVVFSSGWTA